VSDVAETFRLALCEQNDLMNKIIKERDALAKRVAELESWIVWCSKASFPLGALSDKAGGIIAGRAT